MISKNANLAKKHRLTLVNAITKMVCANISLMRWGKILKIYMNRKSKTVKADFNGFNASQCAKHCLIQKYVETITVHPLGNRDSRIIKNKAVNAL